MLHCPLNRFSLCILTAGRSQLSQFELTDLLADQMLFDLHVLGPIHLARTVINNWLSKSEKGHLACTSSMFSFITSPGSSAYSASKAAINNYHDAISAELGSRGISTSIICPGPIETDILINAITADANPANIKPIWMTKIMSVDRCAQLYASALASRLRCVWIVNQPFLSLCYMGAYFPSIMRFILPLIMNEQRLKKHIKGQFSQ